MNHESNSPEVCIAKFMRDIRNAKSNSEKFKFDLNYKAGMQYIIDLAEIWFVDKVIDLEVEK